MDFSEFVSSGPGIEHSHALENSINRLLLKEVCRDLFRIRANSCAPDESYIRAGIEWISSAQDATGDGGVARHYSLVAGWGSSYPETTGYIIPTMLNYARRYSDSTTWDRALQMADWLTHMQLPCGGIQSGTVGERNMVPSVFNTGQVIFGWASAFEATGK